MPDNIEKVAEILRRYGFEAEVDPAQYNLYGDATHRRIVVRVGEWEHGWAFPEGDDPEDVALDILQEAAYHPDLDVSEWDIPPEVGNVLAEEEYQNGDVSEYADHFSEPGYSDPGEGCLIWTANWNPPRMARLAEILEKSGHTVEWSDEWAQCDDCMGLFRHQADSYGWTMHGMIDEHGTMCGDCVIADPADYLRSLEGEAHRAVTIDGLDLEEAGYVRLNPEPDGPYDDTSFQSGLYGGQCDSPEKVAEILEGAVLTRFLFRIDGCGQFDLRFSAWLHREDPELLGEDQESDPAKVEAVLAAFRDALLRGEQYGADPAEAMRKGLEAAAKMPAPPGEGGVVMQRITGDGRALAKRVSGEDFVAGKALDWTDDEAEVEG